MSRQERFSITFFRLRRVPRALQEASKRLSEGFRVEDAIRTPFWSHFGLTKKTLGPQKSRKSYGRYAFFEMFTFSACFGFGTSFWTFWDPLLDVDLAPRPFETGLLGARGPAKSRSRLVFFGPERLQERPRGIQETPRGTQEYSKRPPKPQEAPRRLQEASGDRF